MPLTDNMMIRGAKPKLARSKGRLRASDWFDVCIAFITRSHWKTHGTRRKIRQMILAYALQYRQRFNF
jgi:hypothetical protein